MPKLTDLSVGQCAVLLSLLPESAYIGRLGFFTGVHLSVVAKSKTGIAVRIGNTVYAMCRALAEGIEVRL